LQRDYESMIVLRADLPEAGIKEQLEKLTKILETEGATVRGVHEWGMRELAYLVRKERRGFYALLEYTGEASALLELERQMKLSDAVLRYVSVRQEHPVEVATPAATASEGTATATASEGTATATASEGTATEAATAGATPAAPDATPAATDAAPGAAPAAAAATPEAAPAVDTAAASESKA